MNEQQLDRAYFALSDATRRAILARLAEGEASVSELAAPFAISQPAVSRHLKILEEAGLIRRRIDAQRRPCAIEVDKLDEVNAYLKRLKAAYSANFERLDGLLDDLKTGQKE